MRRAMMTTVPMLVMLAMAPAAEAGGGVWSVTGSGLLEEATWGWITPLQDVPAVLRIDTGFPAKLELDVAGYAFTAEHEFTSTQADGIDTYTALYGDGGTITATFGDPGATGDFRRMTLVSVDAEPSYRGETVRFAASGGTAVPEPSGAVLLLPVCVWVLWQIRRSGPP